MMNNPKLEGYLYLSDPSGIGNSIINTQELAMRLNKTIVPITSNYKYLGFIQPYPYICRSWGLFILAWVYWNFMEHSEVLTLAWVY